ncbi:hypothetical protein [Sorangium sp. So ce204]|uniref:hypothetical protein n=1 Tax=Sorangium sp. So ce204 TaxID=3133288 RepID=UPI003F641893
MLLFIRELVVGTHPGTYSLVPSSVSSSTRAHAAVDWHSCRFDLVLGPLSLQFTK